MCHLHILGLTQSERQHSCCSSWPPGTGRGTCSCDCGQCIEEVPYVQGT